MHESVKARMWLGGGQRKAPLISFLRFGEKRVVVAGLGLMSVGGLVVGASNTYELAFAGRLASSVGAVLLNVLLTKMIADWFAGREIVTAMAILVSSWPLGISLGLISLGSLAIVGLKRNSKGWLGAQDVGTI